MDEQKAQEWVWRFERIYDRTPTRQEYRTAQAKGFPEIYVPGMASNTLNPILETEKNQVEHGYKLLKVVIIILLAILGYIVGFLYT